MDPALRLGLELPAPAPYPDHPGPDQLVAWREAVVAADVSPFGALWVRAGTHASLPGTDPVVLAGAVSAWTTAVTIGVVAPLAPDSRHPSLVARAVTALDLVSGGRSAVLLEADPVVGRADDGWERLAEAVEVCRRLFSREVATYPGRHYAVVEAANRPPPLQPGGPPLVVALAEPAPQGAWEALSGLIGQRAIAALAVEGEPEHLVEVRRELARIEISGRTGRAPALLWRGVLGEGHGADLPRVGADGLILRPPDHTVADRRWVERAAEWARAALG